MENQDTDGNTAFEVQVSDSADIATSIRKMIQEFPPLSSDCCIFRAPKRCRELDQKKPYHPLIVSIGPFHHGKEDLKSMENRKPAYLNAFLDRCRDSSLENCIEKVKDVQSIRNCYAETIKFTDNDFVKMILLDGCFILETILRFNKIPYPNQKETDHISQARIVGDVMTTDMILIENQLPFFVLQKLFNLAFPNSIGPEFSLTNLCIEYFAARLLNGNSSLAKGNIGTRARKQKLEIKHLLDLLRMCQIPSISISNENRKSFTAEYPIGTATELEEAGMVIKRGENREYAIDVSYSTGVLEIPKLMVNYSSERMLKNLIVLESFLYNQESYICDYIHFMDNLIDTSKDVDLLIRNGVIESFSRDNRQLATLINNLRPPSLIKNYLYHEIQEQVSAYCKIPHHKWRAILRRDYCSSPWIIASTIAAIVLLILSFIQAVCSIISIF